MADAGRADQHRAARCCSSIGVFVWGFVDGAGRRAANPDPDRRGDLAMTWLLAGLFAGLLSGAVTWLISLFYKRPVRRGAAQRADDVRGLHRAGGVPARRSPACPSAAGGSIATAATSRTAARGDDERADTDVFAAVARRRRTPPVRFRTQAVRCPHRGADRVGRRRPSARRRRDTGVHQPKSPTEAIAKPGDEPDKTEAMPHRATEQPPRPVKEPTED